MTHPRLLVADEFGGKTEGVIQNVIAPLANLCRTAGGAIDCQLPFGSGFRVLETHGGYSFGQTVRDGYVGYLADNELGDATIATHWVSAVSSQRYSQADLKSTPVGVLPMNAQMAVVAVQNNFAELHDGSFVPKQHISKIGDTQSDFVSVMERFLGVPYLWGGDSAVGIDCSGLVQLALHACGFECFRDSDMQTDLGRPIDDTEPLQRGDLIFWRGHVGAMRDETTLVHANAHAMAVTSEPLDQVVERIDKAGEGNILARRRP